MITQTRIPIVSCRRGYYMRWYYNGWHYWNFLAGTVGFATDGEKYRTTGIRTVQLSSGVVDQNQISAIRSILNSRECYVYTDGGWSECRVESGNVVVERNRIDAYELEMKARIGSRNITPVGYSVGTDIQIITPYDPPEIVSPALENNVYCGGFNADGSGDVRFFGLDRVIYVTRISTGKYNVYQYLGSTDYITLGVGDGFGTASLRAMNSVGLNSHTIHVSDDSTLNDAKIRMFINYGNMANTKIAVGEFSGDGAVITQLYGETLTLGISKIATGTYDITHDIGHTDYIIMGVGVGGAQTTSLRAMGSIANTSVRVYVSDDSSLNDSAIRFIFIWE